MYENNRSLLRLQLKKLIKKDWSKLIMYNNMKESIVQIIIKEAEDLIDEKKEIDEDTVLFGVNGFLDSMGLVSLIVTVEQDIEDEFGKEITIADAKAMSQKNSPFRNVNSLAEYIEKLLKEAE